MREPRMGLPMRTRELARPSRSTLPGAPIAGTAANRSQRRNAVPRRQDRRNLPNQGCNRPAHIRKTHAVMAHHVANARHPSNEVSRLRRARRDFRGPHIRLRMTNTRRHERTAKQRTRCRASRSLAGVSAVGRRKINVLAIGLSEFDRKVRSARRSDTEYPEGRTKRRSWGRKQSLGTSVGHRRT